MKNRSSYKGTLSILVFVTLLISGCTNTESDWENASKRHTIEAYKDFIEKHSDKPSYVQRARARISELTEVREWKNARQLNNIESYTRFVKKYPSGKYTKWAQVKLKKLKLPIEFIEFMKAKKINTIAAYTTFLKIALETFDINKFQIPYFVRQRIDAYSSFYYSNIIQMSFYDILEDCNNHKYFFSHYRNHLLSMPDDFIRMP